VQTPETTIVAPPSGHPAAAHARRWHVLAVLSLMEFMLILDGTVVNVALPSIQRHLGMDTASLAWVVNGYTVVFGGLLLLGGRAGDVLGRRRMLLAGLTLFAAASLSSGLAQNPAMLIVSRIAQGAGAAMVSPAAMALIITAFSDAAERARALGLWGAVAVFGGVSGTVIGGLITDWASWRWIFFVNVPVAVAVLALAPRWVAEGRAAGGRLDMVGAVSITAALGVLLFAVLRTPQAGWASAVTIAPIAVAALLIAAFVLIERRAPQPLVPLGLLGNRTRAASLVSLTLVAAAMGGMLFLITLYFQKILGFDPLRSGLALLPAAIANIGGVALASRLVPRFGVRTVLVAGALVTAAGMAWLSHLGPHSAYLLDVLPGMLLVGLGSTPTFVATQVAGVADLRDEDAGLVSGLLTSALQVGGAIGLGVLVALAAAHTQMAGTHLALLAATVLLVATAAIAAAFVPNLKAPVGR
jgi:EmrB/QacA subfamily drug resistance transporter